MRRQNGIVGPKWQVEQGGPRRQPPIPQKPVQTAGYRPDEDGICRTAGRPQVLTTAQLGDFARDTLEPADFTFKYGNDGARGAWATAANPPTRALRPGAGSAGSDRITLVWPDKAIPNGNWLQVTLLAGARTSLPSSDVLYFGCRIGERVGRPKGAGRTGRPSPPASRRTQRT